MKAKTGRIHEKMILLLMMVGFGCVIAILYLDETVDLPYRFLGASKTPMRMQEFWLEASSVTIVAVMIIAITLWIFHRLRVLESFVLVCAWCRKVKIGDEWVPFENYLKRELDVKPTHGMCPTCRAKAPGDWPTGAHAIAKNIKA
jgi:hypothetical protein